MSLSGRNRSLENLVSCLLLACLLIVGGCAAAKKLITYPSARIDAVDLKDFTLSSFTLEFDIDVENPYSVDLPIVGMEYAIASDGKQFLEGRIGADTAIPALQSRIIPMAVKIPFVSLYEVVQGAKPGMTIPYEAELGLEVSTPLVGKVKLPLKVSDELKIPTFP